MNIKLIALFYALCMATVLAQSSGLEVPVGSKVYVVVEILAPDAAAMGLSREIILNKCELQLRRNGISLGKRGDGLASGFHLYVNCGITGTAFANSLEFKRMVSYSVGSSKHAVMATTYNTGGQGIASEGSFVLQNLLDSIDVFSNEFIKCNLSN